RRVLLPYRGPAQGHQGSQALRQVRHAGAPARPARAAASAHAGCIYRRVGAAGACEGNAEHAKERQKGRGHASGNSNSGASPPSGSSEMIGMMHRPCPVWTAPTDHPGATGKLGFEYIRSSRPKGAIYLESLPVFTRGLARLPNNARLIRELRLLERRTHRSGKDTVEHPRNGHDDHANVVCGVLSLLAPPAFEQPNELTSPIIVSGGPITHLWGGRSGIIEW